MNKKPTLKEFLQSNPNKGLNDYFELYGNEEHVTKTPVIQEPTFYEQPKSYIHPTSKSKIKIDFINIIASVLIIVGFFLPWVDMSGFKNVENIDIVKGLDMYSVFGAFDLESFSEHSNYTIYIILLGASIALLGELIRNWAIRIIGQILVVPFFIYWGYKLYYLFANTTIHSSDLSLTAYTQYGFYIVVVGILLYNIDIMRSIFGKQR